MLSLQEILQHGGPLVYSFAQAMPTHSLLIFYIQVLTGCFG